MTGLCELLSYTIAISQVSKKAIPLIKAALRKLSGTVFKFAKPATPLL